jgi:hypothetical protein
VNCHQLRTDVTAARCEEASEVPSQCRLEELAPQAVCERRNEISQKRLAPIPEYPTGRHFLICVLIVVYQSLRHEMRVGGKDFATGLCCSDRSENSHGGTLVCNR